MPPPDDGWLLLWAMPNITVRKPIALPQIGIFPARSPIVREAAKRHPALGVYLKAFRDEFGQRVSPAIIGIRENAPDAVRTVDAIASFRDAAAISTIVKTHSYLLKYRSSQLAVRFSDAFEFYPWSVERAPGTHLVTQTPALGGIHYSEKLRATCAPALGQRDVSEGDLDASLWQAICDAWRQRFVDGVDTVESRRLFRALDMARSATKMPGSADSSVLDVGRAVTLWVSAFEILAHDGKSDEKRVLALLNRVSWRQQKSEPHLAEGVHISTVASRIYKALNRERNRFTHGNAIEEHGLAYGPRRINLLRMAAPLFRLALTAYLDIRSREPAPPIKHPRKFTDWFYRTRLIEADQELAEEALLRALTPEEGW